jgi:hypothetical protein
MGCVFARAWLLDLLGRRSGRHGRAAPTENRSSLRSAIRRALRAFELPPKRRAAASSDWWTSPSSGWRSVSYEESVSSETTPQWAEPAEPDQQNAPDAEQKAVTTTELAVQPKLLPYTG